MDFLIHVMQYLVGRTSSPFNHMSKQKQWAKINETKFANTTTIHMYMLIVIFYNANCVFSTHAFGMQGQNHQTNNCWNSWQPCKHFTVNPSYILCIIINLIIIR